MNAPLDLASLSPAHLTSALRAGAVGSYPAEAAVELLIRDGRWLARPDFVRACVCALVDDGEVLAVDWSAAQRHVTAVEATPAERAVGLIAVQLGAYPDPAEAPIDAQGMPPLAWLLPNLARADVDLVVAAISHAAGTHHHVDHVGEPTPAGEWLTTPTSPRLSLGPVHAWPEPAGAGLEG